MRSVGVEGTSHASQPIAAEFGFAVTVLYLVFDYGRPQDQIGLIGALHPSMILTSLMLILFLRNTGQLHKMASPQTTRMLLLLLLLAIHVPFATNTGRALNIIRNLLLVFITSGSIIFFVNTPQRLRVFLRWWIYLMLYVAVNGILGGGSAGSSFLADENDFALLMNMMLPFGIFLFFYEVRKKTKLFYLIASLLCIASIVISFSRGGFVGLVVVAFVVWLANPKKILSFALVCLLALAVYFFAGDAYWNEMSTIQTADDANAQSRIELWITAWEMFKDHPFGVGPANFPVLLPEYQNAYFGDRDIWGKEVHSIWFTLLPELGIPGVLLYLSLLAANVRDIRYLRGLKKRPGDEDAHRLAYFLSLAFTASLAGYFAAGTFLSVLYYPHYWYLTAMLVATRHIIESMDSTEDHASGVA